MKYTIEKHTPTSFTITEQLYISSIERSFTLTTSYHKKDNEFFAGTHLEELGYPKSFKSFLEAKQWCIEQELK